MSVWLQCPWLLLHYCTGFQANAVKALLESGANPAVSLVRLLRVQIILLMPSTALSLFSFHTCQLWAVMQCCLHVILKPLCHTFCILARTEFVGIMQMFSKRMSQQAHLACQHMQEQMCAQHTTHTFDATRRKVGSQTWCMCALCMVFAHLTNEILWRKCGTVTWVRVRDHIFVSSPWAESGWPQNYFASCT